MGVLLKFSSIHERIGAIYPSLPQAQQRVADYLLSHTDEIAFLTVERLAAASGVSPATITRFAVQVGYSGYPALQEAVRESVRRRLAPPQRLQELPQDDLFSRSFDLEIRSLQEARELNPQPVLERAVQLLLEAKWIYVVAMGSTYPVAVHAARVLHQGLGKVSLISGTGGFLAEELVTIQPGEVLLAISLPRYGRSVLDVIRYAREKGLTILLLTDSHRSPAAGMADLVLRTPFESASFFNANTAAMAVANAVLAGVGAARKSETTARLQAVEESIRHLKGLYE